MSDLLPLYASQTKPEAGPVPPPLAVHQKGANEPTKRGLKTVHWVLDWDIGPAGKFPSAAVDGGPGHVKLLVHLTSVVQLQASKNQIDRPLGKHPPKAAPPSGVGTFRTTTHPLGNYSLSPGREIVAVSHHNSHRSWYIR